MAGKQSTKFPGVRFREHPTRKHGVGADRYFFIRYKLDGKDKEEACGWASDGWTATKAFKLLTAIRENIKAGAGPTSLAEIREVNQAKNKARAKGNVSFAEFWQTEYWPAAELSKTPRTLETERGYYGKWLAGSLGDIPLPKIDVVKLEALKQRLQKSEKSAATITKVLGIVRQVWNMAVTRDIIQGDYPGRRLKMPRQDNARVRYLEPDEAKAMLDALKPKSIDCHDEALIALFCGLRAGEIFKLTMTDLDFSAGTLLIRDAKNGRSRHAYMTAEIRDMLHRRTTGKGQADFVFPAGGGKQRQWVSGTFDRVIKELGFNKGRTDARQKVCFHTLRHTFASWLVKNGEPLYNVAKLMGHTTIRMTERYAHLAPDVVRQAAMGLEGMLDKRPAKIIHFRPVAGA
ncbi:MAG: tyrosine-type recombinase/integrase [Desulfovibrio sp.]|nr:tyrosine-type recombinase/integrase [Desulfovibrio sp.]